MTWRSILAEASLVVAVASCAPASTHPGVPAPVPTVTIASAEIASSPWAPTPLVPISLAAQEAGQFTRWKLTNDSADVIRPVGGVGWYVRLESRTPEGWVAAPISYCATVAPYLEPLRPGRSMEVVTLCPIDREVLPAGEYRAVIGYIEDMRVAGAREAGGAPAPAAAPMEPSMLALSEFEVMGLDIAESMAFVDALSGKDVQSCLDAASLDHYVEVFTWVGHRSVLPRLLDVPAKSYDEQLVLARAVTVLPEAGHLLLRAQAERTGDASVAAGVALYTSRVCAASDAPCREVAARWTRRLQAGDLSVLVVNALAEKPIYWPPALPAVLLAHLESTRSVKALAPLARALEGMPDEALPSAGRPSVLALRRRGAGRVNAETRSALLEAADRLAERTGMQKAPEFGLGGRALSRLPERGGLSSPCDAIFHKLQTRLRFNGPEELPIRHGRSLDEPGPWVSIDMLPWLN